MKLTDFLHNAITPDMTVAEAIAAGYCFEAIQSGNERARAEVTDRLDGALKGHGDLNLLNQGGNVLIVRGAPELGA